VSSNVSDSAVTGDIKLNVSIASIDVNSNKDVSVFDTVDIKIIGDVLGSFINQTTFIKDNITTINTSAVNITLEILSNETIDAYMNLAEKAENPVSVDASGIGFRYALIDAESSLDDALVWAVIKLYYEDSNVVGKNIEENTLRLYVYNTSATQWQLLDNTDVDTSENFVWGNVSHFSLFGVYGSPIPSQAEEGESPGGGGGGGGGCIYDWQCTGWSVCSEDETQTRTCANAGTCLGDFGKPDEVKDCAYTPPKVEEVEEEEEEPTEAVVTEEKEEEPTEPIAPPTGGLLGITSRVIQNLFGGETNPTVGLVIILFIVTLGLVAHYAKFKKK